MNAAGIDGARAAARRLLDGFGVRQPEDIRVRAIAWALGAQVVEGELEGAVARLIRVGKRARIRLSDRVEHPGARRFSIAHELGHLVLAHHGSAFTACSKQSLMGGAESAEAEANAFAAELLMPTPLVRPLSAVTGLNLHRARAIAGSFRTSLLASAIRLVELSPEPCAAVFAQGNRVQWAARSATFTVAIPRGGPLLVPDGFVAQAEPIAELDAVLWLVTPRPGS